jgi:hypothetical protein
MFGLYASDKQIFIRSDSRSESPARHLGFIICQALAVAIKSLILFSWFTLLTLMS